MLVYKVAKSCFATDSLFILKMLLSTCCEFFTTQKHLIPVFQYSLKCKTIVVRHEVSKPKSGLVVHLFEAANHK